MSKYPLPPNESKNTPEDQAKYLNKLSRNLAITPEEFFVQPMKQIKEGIFLQHDGLQGRSLQPEPIQQFQAATRLLKTNTLVGLDSYLTKKCGEKAQGEFFSLSSSKTAPNINEIKLYAEDIHILFKPYFCDHNKLPLHLQRYPGVIDLIDARHSRLYYAASRTFGWPLTLDVIDEITDIFTFECLHYVNQLTTITDQWHKCYCDAFGEPSLYELTRLVLTMADNIALLLPSDE